MPMPPASSEAAMPTKPFSASVLHTGARRSLAPFHTRRTTSGAHSFASTSRTVSRSSV
jgi:hypothetical protein